MPDGPVRPTPGVNLRIYDDFAEVRLKVESTERRLSVSFPPETWQQIMPYSLNLLELPFTFMSTAPQPNWLASLEGQVVWLETPEGRQEVTLIRAGDVLVRDTEGTYFRVSDRQLRFPAPPPASTGEGTVVEFDLHAPGEGVLSYLTRALSWQAHYTLEIDGNGTAQLTGQAELNNRSEQLLVPEQVTLLGGQVQLSTQRSARRTRPLGMAFAVEPRFAPEFEEVREVGGLYIFELRQPPALPARGSAVVPFQDIDLQAFEPSAGLFRTFDSRSGTHGTCTRHYTLRAAQPLLGAQVTVRDQGFLMGQTTWDETASGETVTFSLGPDPDVTYTRSVQEQVAAEEPEQGDPDTDTRRVNYQVAYVFRNAKARPVLLRLGERVRYGTVLALNGEAVLTDGHVTFEATLSPGEVRELRYELVLEIPT